MTKNNVWSQNPQNVNFGGGNGGFKPNVQCAINVEGLNKISIYKW